MSRDIVHMCLGTSFTVWFVVGSPWSGAHMLGPQLPKVESMRHDKAADITCLRRFPCCALEKDLEHRSAQALKQRDQTPHRRRRRLPQPRRTAEARWLRARQNPAITTSPYRRPADGSGRFAQPACRLSHRAARAGPGRFLPMNCANSPPVGTWRSAGPAGTR
jgi:hypothetical protein